MSAFLEYVDTQRQRQPEPLPPQPPQGGLVMDQRHDIISNIQHRDVTPDRDPHPMEGKTLTKYGEDFNKAMQVLPALRQYWVPPPEHKTENGYMQAIWESAKRDSFIGNIGRWLDKVEQEYGRSAEQEQMIRDAKEELTWNISEDYHEDILNAPTMGLAMREAARIRHREEQLRREHHQSIGKTLVADIAGIMIDPSNYIPGFGMMKGVQLANRARRVSAIQSFANSTKMQQMGALAVAGGFEEAIRMAPRYASDPTFEANNYYEGIAMSAAFSGLLPAAFGGVKHGLRRGTEILPNVANDINAHLHAWGVDVAVRQAMRFPGALKDTGFRDPGTALRKSKELAQDNVNTKVKEINARKNKRQFDEAIKEDFSGDSPSTTKATAWMEDQITRAGDAALARTKIKLRRTATATGATAAATAVGGPLAGVATATLFANKDYLAIAARHVAKKRQIRRTAYDAAISAGDEKKAVEILRQARAERGPTKIEAAIEAVEEQIATAVDTAKVRIRQINEQAKVC